jgi:glycosyltransferase involved in cell wall biosynthesis
MPLRKQNVSDVLRINLFTIGNSEDIATWSNFPYFFSNELVNKGIALTRINIAPHRRVQSLYDKVHRFIRVIFRFFGLQHQFDYFRSDLNYFLTRRVIAKACKKYSSAHFNIFMTFSFSSRGISRIPFVLYCDQTLAEYCENQEDLLQRKYIQRSISREQHNFQDASYVFSTNMHCIDFIKSAYGITNAALLPIGLNLPLTAEMNRADIMAKKRAGLTILFIGTHFYDRGVDILLSAFKLIHGKHSEAELHIVGLTKEACEGYSNNVYYYGYLRKDNAEQYKKYCALLETAFVFIFPARKGPLPFAISEAMYFFTPVICSKFWGIEQDIDNGSNGIIINSLDPADYCAAVTALLGDPALWEKVSVNSHFYARKHTWSAIVDEFLDRVRMPPGGKLSKLE